MGLRRIETTRMKAARRASLLFLVLFLSAAFAAVNGCGGGAAFAPMEREPFQEALSDLNVRWRLMESMRTQMIVKVNDPSGSQEVRAVLHFKKPDSFRFSALDPAGRFVAVMVASEEQLTEIYIRSNAAVRGPLSDARLKRLFEMDVRVSDIRRAVAANPFVGAPFIDGNLRRTEDEAVLIRPIESTGGEEEVRLKWISGEPVVSEWKQRAADGAETLAIRFWNYRSVGGLLRPMDVSIERQPEQVSMRFRLIDPQVNLELKPSLFRHALPPGARTIWVNDEGDPIDPPSEGEDQSVP